MLSKKMTRLGLVFLLSISLSACSNAKQEEAAPQPAVAKPVKLTLDFFTTPTAIKVGQEAQLRLSVKKLETVLSDAMVEMEIWREGDPTHTKENAEFSSLGFYVLKKTFTVPGDYHVTLHTTTKEIHQMPTVDFKVTE